MIKTESRQGSHRNLLNAVWWLDGRGVGGRMDTCVCMAESLCCSPETVTTLLTGYIPIQNNKLKKKKKIPSL